MEEVLNKLRKPYPQDKLEFGVCAAILLLLIFGVIASISFKNWQYFERTGSLIVILGVSLAWRDLSRKIDKQRNHLAQEISAQLKNLEEPKRGLLTQAMNATEANRLKHMQSDIDTYLKLLNKRVLALEAFTLMLGTFVWGYGSLIGRLF